MHSILYDVIFNRFCNTKMLSSRMNFAYFLECQKFEYVVNLSIFKDAHYDHAQALQHVM